MGESDRFRRRRDDQALEEIRRLFERYRTIARHEAAADRHHAARARELERRQASLVQSGR